MPQMRRMHARLLIDLSSNSALVVKMALCCIFCLEGSCQGPSGSECTQTVPHTISMPDVGILQSTL